VKTARVSFITRWGRKTHVAVSTVGRLMDYVINTPEDPLFSKRCVGLLLALIQANI
jgi:4-O-beta-D-mannosyl-D-glucose phosphorylase